MTTKIKIKNLSSFSDNELMELSTRVSSVAYSGMKLPRDIFEDGIVDALDYKKSSIFFSKDKEQIFNFFKAIIDYNSVSLDDFQLFTKYLECEDSFPAENLIGEEYFIPMKLGIIALCTLVFFKEIDVPKYRDEIIIENAKKGSLTFNKWVTIKAGVTNG